MSVSIGFGTGYPEPSTVLKEIFENGRECEFIEVADGKAFRFVVKNGKMESLELTGQDGQTAVEQWGDGFLGSIGYEDWNMLSPDSCHLFFPMMDEFFTSYQHQETGEVRYAESMGATITRMKNLMQDLREDGLTEDQQYETCVFLMEKIEVAIKNKFVFGLS